jgi:hypothetical protein
VLVPSLRVACPVCHDFVEKQSERAVPWCGRCDEGRKRCPDLDEEWTVAPNAEALLADNWSHCEQRGRCDGCRGLVFVVESSFPVQWRVHCFPEGPCVIQSVEGAGRHRYLDPQREV